eukprot:9532389-Lingulodinium_polyedra.AAC.1
MEHANLRFATCNDGGRLIRSHRCAMFAKRCAPMRSSRPSAAATARKLHARAPHAHASFLARA